jgi:homogentisate 1,2-dioxygenase
MSGNWIALPKSEGRAARQAHADMPEGTYEREFGREGFFGPATQIYHRRPPTGWVDWQGPLRPRAFDTNKLDRAQGGPLQAQSLLVNSHVEIRLWHQQAAMDHLVRNADGDELLFVHQGSGELYTDFGHMSFRDGDYIVLPKTTTWRIEPASPVTALMIEATNEIYRLPDRGTLGNHAVFDPGVLETPALDEAHEAQQSDEAWQIRIKARGTVSTVTYPYNPLDAVGWQGTVMPVKLNWRDIRPVMSHRYHVPPSAHCTFLGGRFVVCTFVPRPFESDPGVMKVPYFHSNNDYDEVLFLHAGNFFSRDNAFPGALYYHPAGFPHGPQPKALANAYNPKNTHTEEVAVMIDTRDPLTLTGTAESVEVKDYIDAWGAANARAARKQAAE